MAHIFEIMSIVTSQINILTDYYGSSGRNSIRKLPTIPEHIYAAIDRYLMRHEDIIYDKNLPISTKVCTSTNCEDVFTNIYVCVINNITKPIIDKMTIYVDHKDQRGPGIGIFVGIPKIAFNQDYNAPDSSQLLRDIYTGLLELDVDMQFKPSIHVIRVANDKRIDIHSYDIQMNYSALCFMNVIMKNWFGNNAKDIEEYTLCSFDNNELPEKKKKKVIDIVNKFGISISTVRDSIEKGTLMKAISEE